MEGSERLQNVMTTGFVHSYFPGSSVDGPGVRFVLWLSGCAFRCQYCHNPDTWHLHNGKEMSIAEVLDVLRPYEPFLNGAHGGVTISGGEPLIQPDFVRSLVDAFHGEGFHVALDTNGFYGSKLSDSDWQKIDLTLLDIKSFDPAIHLEAVEQPVAPVLATAQRLADLSRPVWIRFVLVPGLTDQPHNVEGLADFVATLGNIERVEVLPFHQMGAFKWKELGLEYRLANTQPPTSESVAWVQETFRSRGLEVV